MATKTKEQAAQEALKAIREQIGQTTRALADLAPKMRERDAAVGELRIKAEDAAIEGGPGIDYGAIRRAQDERTELKMERAHLELKLAVLGDEEAKAEVRALEEEMRTLRPKEAELREDLRRLGGPQVGDMPNLGGEVGILVGQILACEDRRAQLRQSNVARQNRISDARNRLEAVMEGRPDPGPSVRLDDKGRIVDTAVRVG